MSEAAIWHDVENGGYDADLPLWRELAAAVGGPVLDLGAGTGRVALNLAEAGHDVTAVDSDEHLLDELALRARGRGLSIECLHGDARVLRPHGGFALAIAPMQFVQIVGGAAGRRSVLERVAASLLPGGTFAAAIADLDEAVAAEDAPPPVPDVSQRGDWIYSSLPLDVRREPGGVAVEWLRQRVSPEGELSEQRHTQMLDSVAPEQLEQEAAAAGLHPVERHVVPETDTYIGSLVVVCRR